MAFPKSFQISAIVGGVVGAAALASTFIHWPPGEDRTIPERIGREMAAEAVRLRGASGRIVVLARDTEEFPQRSVDAALASFQAELDRSGTKAEAIRRFQVDPLRMVQVPPGDFFELMRRSKAGDVLVSFMGPPLLSEQQRSTLGNIQPKVVAFCPGYLPRYINLALMAERGLLHGGVVARTDASGDRYEGQYEKFVVGAKPRP